MSKVMKRMPLTDAGFPLLSSLSQQSIVITQGDMAPTKDRFPMPQAVAMQNVLPTATGYKSIIRNQQNQYSGGLDPDYSQATVVVPLRDALDVVRLLFFAVTGEAFIDDRRTNIHSLGTFSTDGTNVSYAYIKQETYVFIKGVGCYVYSVGDNALVKQELGAIEPTAIHGVCAASGYLILYDSTTIYYSSLTDPTDFYPEHTIDSGAGSIKPLYLKGPIIHCESIEGGFLIYTTKNIVSAQYSGQFTQPFVFREISNSSGITQHCHVTLNTNNKTHYAWTEAGLLQVSNSAAQLIVPEVTEFLQRRVEERFSIGVSGPIFDGPFEGMECNFKRPYLMGHTVIQNTMGGPVPCRLSYIGNRYLIISYSPGESSDFSWALVYDETINRWSKFHFKHIAFFDNPVPSNPQAYRYTDLSATTYAQLGADGTTYSDFYKVNNANQKQDNIIGFLTFDTNPGTYYIDSTIRCSESTSLNKQEDASSFWNLSYIQLRDYEGLLSRDELPFVLFGFLDITRDNSIDLTDIVFNTVYRFGPESDYSGAYSSNGQLLPVFVSGWPSVAGEYAAVDLYAFNCTESIQAISMIASSHEYIIGVVGAFDLSGFSFGAKAGGRQSLISRKA